MRATLRTTWLLLSLNFLFDSICSDGSLSGSVTPPLPPVRTTTKIQTTASNAPTDKATTAAPPATTMNNPSNSTAQPPDTTATISVIAPLTTNKAPPAEPQTNVAPTPPLVKSPPLNSTVDEQMSMFFNPVPPTVIPPSTVIPAGLAPNSDGKTPTPGAATGRATGAPTGAATGAPTGAVTGAATGGATGGATGAPTGRATGAATGGATGAPTGGATGAPTGGATGAATVKTTEAPTTPSKTPKVPTNTQLVPHASTAPGTEGPTGVPTTGHITSTDPTGDTTATPQTTLHPTSSGPTGPPTDQRTTQGTTREAKMVVTITTEAVTPSSQTEKFTYDRDSEQGSPEDTVLAEVCRRLTPSWQSGTCTLTLERHNNTVKFVHVEINGQVKTSLADQIYEEITKKPTDNKTLIAILSSCGALLIMIVILAVCASHHRKPYNENQQHLTEELHTVENGYHDNPTLEVMEVQPEMQEKKLALNGEFNDSWIVPFDNLLKDDMPDEEDTHL